MTSPLAVIKLVLILAKSPLYMVRTVAGYFVPNLFYKDLSQETILITVRCPDSSGTGSINVLTRTSLVVLFLPFRGGMLTCMQQTSFQSDQVVGHGPLCACIL